MLQKNTRKACKINLIPLRIDLISRRVVLSARARASLQVPIFSEPSLFTINNVYWLTIFELFIQTELFEYLLGCKWAVTEALFPFYLLDDVAF